MLYELREADFFAISRSGGIDHTVPGFKEHRDPSATKDPDVFADRELNTGGDPDSEGRTRWEKAMIAFTMLKAKIAQTPILKHFGPDRTPVIVVYASKWAVSAALLQNYDGVYWPVTFTSRTLKSNEIN